MSVINLKYAHMLSQQIVGCHMRERHAWSSVYDKVLPELRQLNNFAFYTLFNLRDFWVFSGMKTMKTPED